MDTLNLDASRLHISETKQFFFDNLIVESVQSLTRRVHSPVKVEEPLIQSDKPWEHVTYFTCNAWRVLRDPQDNMFKCWYEDWAIPHDWMTSPGSSRGVSGYPTRYLYASSVDGLKWEKPELDIVVEQGQKTNIVFGDKEFGSVHSAFVFLDPLEKSEEHRFKMLFNHRTAGIADYELASSPDGILWTPWRELPRFGPFGPHLGDVLIISVDENSRTYLLNGRHSCNARISLNSNNPTLRSFSHAIYPEYPARQVKRRIFRAESADLLNWTNLHPILVPDDELDNVDDAFYGMAQYETGGMWIGFLNVFHMTDNTMDVQMVFSRDGRNFKRIQPGRPWLTTGGPGTWDQYMVTICSAPVQVGEDLYVYHGGAKNHHDWWMYGLGEKHERGNCPTGPAEMKVDRFRGEYKWWSFGCTEGLDVPEASDMDQVAYCLGLAKMKKDRFVSLGANAVRPGLLVTKPFCVEGGKLFINARCGACGFVRVEAADGGGEVIPGFERDKCVLFTGDSIEHQVTWESKRELPEGWLKLHFYMKNADLYTFQLRK